LRVERGVTYHGIALNVTTRLEDFELIDPCGMAGLDVTSIAREREWDGPVADASTELLEQVGAEFAADFARRLAAATDDTAERRTGEPAVAGI
jgi:lipoyl(octanoyl) transferase